MVPLPYLGIWRRDWIDRYDAHGVPRRELQPAIWFQSHRYHVDLRIDPKLSGVGTQTPPAIFAQSQIAFAGSTVVDISDNRALCRWHPQIAYPHLTDDVDAGYMHFDSATHLLEHGVDGSYQESWQRINRTEDAIRCLRFVSSDDAQYTCFLMLCGPYFALGSNFPDVESPHLPVYAWGQRDHRAWIIRESIVPWHIDRIVTIAPALLEMTTSILPISEDWTLPLMHNKRWRLIEID